MADFPTLPGIQITVQRSLVFATTVREGDNQCERRTTWRTAPRYRYSLQIEFLTVHTGELQTLLQFVDTHRGMLGSFTFTDPYDSQERLVRFESDELAYDRFHPEYWRVTSLDLITVD